jgi:hypothetical protein
MVFTRCWGVAAGAAMTVFLGRVEKRVEKSLHNHLLSAKLKTGLIDIVEA